MSQNQPSPSGGGPPGAPSGLPDINGGQLPFEVAQKLLDEVAWINLYASPGGGSAVKGSGGIVGVEASQALHRFEIGLLPPSLEGGVRSTNVVGQRAGKLDLRWLMIPWDFEARPDREPPPTALDPTRSQRFALQVGGFSFGGGNDGFSSFGTGRTIPVTESGRPRLLVAAVASTLQGSGRFTGLPGTVIFTGTLDPDRGFEGEVLVRVLDPEARIRGGSNLSPIEPVPSPDPQTTYLLWRNQKTGPQDKSLYNFGSGGDLRGVDVALQMRSVEARVSSEGAAGLRTEFKIGSAVGKMNTFTAVNPLVPVGGTGAPDAPFRFQGIGRFTFLDSQQRSVGGFAAQFLEGRNFGVQFPAVPEQPAVRFGFFGPAVPGSGFGCFEGLAGGLLLGNTGTTIAPHVFSNLYVLRIHDPQGKYRAPGG